GVVVHELGTPPELQADVIERVARANPETADDARAIAADALEHAMDRQTRAEIAQQPASLAAIDARAVPNGLVQDHGLYFNEGGREIGLSDLISRKSDEENARAADNAAKRMAASAAGELPRREPIKAAPIGNGKYVVVDGNGTVTAARKFNFQTL